MSVSASPIGRTFMTAQRTIGWALAAVDGDGAGRVGQLKTKPAASCEAAGFVWEGEPGTEPTQAP
jgi:hypothetical protein